MANTIISDIYVTIYAKKLNNSKDEVSLEKRSEILKELGIDNPPDFTEEDDFWLFYERYKFSKEDYDKIKTIVEKNKDSFYRIDGVTVAMDCLYDYEYAGTIELNSRVRVSDPCYDMDTWCAGSLENVLPGMYKCFFQRTEEGRVAAIKVVHLDYDSTEPTEIQNIDVGVDSGMCGIYEEEYFSSNCKKDEWYDEICHLDDTEIFDGKAFVSSSGFGDGSYRCFVERNAEGQIIAIKIVFIDFDEDRNEE